MIYSFIYNWKEDLIRENCITDILLIGLLKSTPLIVKKNYVQLFICLLLDWFIKVNQI